MKKIILFLLLFPCFTAFAQSGRITDENTINWVQTLNTIALNQKWSLHVEYQLRRTEGIKKWQQSLLRLGLNYKIRPDIILHGGYGYIETFPYGDFPIAADGKFPEHRLYEQLSLKQSFGKWSLVHRFRLEQRWLGKVRPNMAEREIEEWIFLNRFRYQFKVQHPLWERQEKQIFAALANEIFIGSGKNLGLNIFDQNRFSLSLGYKFNKRYTVEFSYLNQILQQGKAVSGQVVIQQNKGLVLSSSLNF